MVASTAVRAAQGSLPELRLGPVDFQPRLTAGMKYDDNILISSHNTQSDVIWSVQPAFLGVAGDRLAIEDHQRNYLDVIGFTPDTFIVSDPANWPGKTLLLDYGPRFNWFTKHTENDSIDQLLTFNALWPMAKLVLGARQEYRLENTTIVEAGRRTDMETIPTDLMAGYRISERTSAELNLHRASVDYEKTTGLLGYTDWNAESWLNYQVAPRLTLSAGATLGILDVPEQKGQTYEEVLARARYLHSERMTVDLSVGGQFRQFDSGIDPTFEPVFNVTASYRPIDTTWLYLTGYRREYPSVNYGLNYLMTGATLGGRQQLGDRYFLSLAVDYFVLDYTATVPGSTAARTDDYFQARAGFEVRFTRHLIGRLAYTFRTVDSNTWDGFTDNQVGTQFTWTY